MKTVRHDCSIIVKRSLGAYTFLQRAFAKKFVYWADNHNFTYNDLILAIF